MSADVTALDGLTSLDAVRKLEAHMRELPQVDVQTLMTVFGQVCARSIFIPAGTLLTGAETARDNVCVVLGDITVTTDEGPKRLSGFNVLTAKAGQKRAGIAHADTWWVTVHHTTHETPSDIEREMTPEPEALQKSSQRLAAKEVLCLG